MDQRKYVKLQPKDKQYNHKDKQYNHKISIFIIKNKWVNFRNQDNC